MQSSSSRRERPARPRRCRCVTRRSTSCSTRSIASLRGERDRARRACPTSCRCRSRCGPASTRCCSRSSSAFRSCSMDHFEPREFARLVHGARHPFVGAAAGRARDARCTIPRSTRSNRCGTCGACRRRSRPRTRASSTNASGSRCSTATARPSSVARRSVGAPTTGSASASRSSARSAARTTRSRCASRGTDEIGELEIHSIAGAAAGRRRDGRSRDRRRLAPHRRPRRASTPTASCGSKGA